MKGIPDQTPVTSIVLACFQNEADIFTVWRAAGGDIPWIGFITKGHSRRWMLLEWSGHFTCKGQQPLLVSGTVWCWYMCAGENNNKQQKHGGRLGFLSGEREYVSLRGLSGKQHVPQNYSVFKQGEMWSDSVLQISCVSFACTGQ